MNTIQSLFKMIEALFFISFSLIALISIHIYILIVALGSALCFLLVPRFFNEYLERAAYAVSKINEIFSNKVNSSLAGFEAFIFGNCKENIHLLVDEASEQLEFKKYKFNRLQSLLTMISSLFYRFFEFTTLVLTALLVSLHVISIGAMFAVSNLSSKLLNGATDFIKYYVLFKSTSQLFKKYAIIESSEQASDFTIKEKISFQNVSLKFGSETILKDINLEFQMGKKYAITGRSGCGKSSLIKMILKMYACSKGRISLDGINLDTLTPQKIYHAITYIPQQPYVFEETIRFNLTLGRDYEIEEINNVLEKVGLLEFVYSLPNGLDTILKNDGKNISGGQKQRIVIARGLLENKNVYLIDECTSSLDKESSNLIDNYFLSLKDVMVIYITHKLDEDTAKQFDHVYML